jgi:hypothetical protein
MPQWNDPQYLYEQASQIKRQLPQYNPDAQWAYDTSRVFGGYGDQKKANMQALEHGLNLKEQDLEMLQQRALIEALKRQR